MRTLILTANLCKRALPTLTVLRQKSSQIQNAVILESFKDKGVITLNRPKALNAIDLPMGRKIYAALENWENEKMMVIIKGSGDKAFSAGGDVRAALEATLRGEKWAYELFKLAYKASILTGTYKIPYFAFIDGIVMGGGVGLSVHGPFRITTERTVFAMPETQIGFFPDVGSSHFMPRLKRNLGIYLSLTGYRLVGHDVVHAGVGTHFVPSEKLHDLEADLLNCTKTEEIDGVVDRHNKTDLQEFSLAPYLEQIDYCFSAGTMEEIVDRLKSDNSGWASKTLRLLSRMSPTSLKVTLKQMEYGSTMSLQDCLNMEYRMLVNFLGGKDFYEGVRALLIDKDQKPVWSPATLEQVSDELVESHFKEPAEIRGVRLYR